MKYLFIFLACVAFQQHQLNVSIGPEELAFVSFEDGLVNFETKSIQFSDLPFVVQKQVMDHTGWGRVWEDKTGAHHVTADLVEVTENVVVLERADGSRITVATDKLSKVDRAYAESRRKLSGALPESFQAKVVSVSDGDTVRS